MKKNTFRRPCRPNHGFTLVEMLVVIAIIAILAAAISVAAGKAIQAANRAKANVIATQIQTAILNYQTEYGVFPIVAPVPATLVDTLLNTTGTSSAGETPLMTALCGNLNASTATAVTSTVPNSRVGIYLTPKRSDVDASGVLVTPFNTAAIPCYFSIAMDSDYSGVLGDNPTSAQPQNFVGWTGSATTATAAGNAKTTQPVAVWACCDPAFLGPAATNANSKTPAFWVHTY